MRHERPRARPKRLQIGDEEDDEPTYVEEESNNTLSKAEYDAIISKPEKEEQIELDTQPQTKPEKLGAARSPPSKETIIDFGARKKRKAGKIITEEVVQLPNEGSKPTMPDGDVLTVEVVPKTKKSKRQMKLSFDE